MPHEALVRIAGEAFRLPVTVLQAEFQRGGAFRETLLRYTQTLLTQLAQAVVDGDGQAASAFSIAVDPSHEPFLAEARRSIAIAARFKRSQA